ncbi:hypothetical protein BJ165DRAFT_1409209 [Panaeolus papilionaceus]|nr:hypothetical protein BJ165DRAFT_1409209 [Panaeolus papilionaceus]
MAKRNASSDATCTDNKNFTSMNLTASLLLEMPRGALNPFLDLEAEVDRNEEEEDSDDENAMQDFINFDKVLDDESQCAELYHTWNGLQEIEGGSDGDDDEEGQVESFLAHLERHKASHAMPDTSADSSLQRKYPLHQVACRVGMEEEVMSFLLQKTRDKHIATIVDQPVIALLMKAPGIRKTTRGPIMQGVDQPDWSKLLTMKTLNSRSIEVGEWVTIKTGMVYKGDVALVKRVDAWGSQVLVVPRMQPLVSGNVEHVERSKKRKSTHTVPEARLFHEWETVRAMGIAVIEDAPYCYRFGDNSFEYGLSIDRLPKPKEWMVEEGDVVKDTASERKGRLLKIETTCVELESDDKSGIYTVPWRFVRKVVDISDYVVLASGENGWVVGKSDDIVHIVTKIDEQAQDGSAGVKEIDIHVNRIKHAQPAFVGTAVQPAPHLPLPKDYIPWIGTRVLITKEAWKGRHACIRSVFMYAENPKLLVRLENYNPHHAFNDVTLGVDDVVEAAYDMLFDMSQWSQTNLIEYSKKKSLYIPMALHGTSSTGSSTSTASGYDRNLATPLPTPITTPSTLERAWDPNARTPAGFQTPRTDEATLEATSSTHPPPTATVPSHPLLDRRLMNIKLKANVHGGNIPGTQMIVWLNERNGTSVGIQCMRNGALGWLQPNWLELRHPNPARADNGLMVVVDNTSEHFGKLVRRVSHYQNANRTLMRCVVVTCEPGRANVITTEELDSLDKSQLCLCFESKEEKLLNKTVVSQLRAGGRNRLSSFKFASTHTTNKNNRNANKY